MRAPFALAALLCILAPAARAEDIKRAVNTGVRSATDLVKDLSFEEVLNLNIRVTSVSKKPEKVSQAPAAIHVITQEDIRRSGVTNIPDALRMAPGLQVSRLNAHQWGISSRGFNDVFANKLLVLIDGRSVYTPLFSGVFWDSQHVFMEDVERIEVIRGPGATLWGANAVNGVINVISKKAKDTQGGLVKSHGGTEEFGGGFRYGGKVKEDIHIRGYVDYFNVNDSETGRGKANDAWQLGQTGFRLDWDPCTEDSITFQSDGYLSPQRNTLLFVTPDPPFTTMKKEEPTLSGGNILGRWSHTFSETSSSTLQMYYDHTDRPSSLLADIRDTFDLDFQLRLAPAPRHEMVVGFGYRASLDDTDGSFNTSFFDPDRRNHLISAFAQDQITLIDRKLFLTLGSKFERNDFTGFEVQPSARLLWTPHARHTVWAAVSRAVRTPSRADDNARINTQVLPPGAVFPGSPTAVARLQGTKEFESEELIAYEIGYRSQLHKTFSLDIAGFYNFYDNLRSIEPRPPFAESDRLILPFDADNLLYGETFGAEVAATWQALKWWRLHAAYSNLQIQLHLQDGSADTTSENAEEDSPQNQFTFRSSMDLPHNLELDWALRYVDRLPNRGVEAYVVGDVRVGWHATKKLEISITGQNLFERKHREFSPSFINTESSEVERSVYLKAVWKF